jgi:hypothetical protein
VTLLAHKQIIHSNNLLSQHTSLPPMSNQEVKQQAQYKQILERMLQEPENKVCADCNASGSFGDLLPVLTKV